jgi:hypothetical protein
MLVRTSGIFLVEVVGLLLSRKEVVIGKLFT